MQHVETGAENPQKRRVRTRPLRAGVHRMLHRDLPRRPCTSGPQVTVSCHIASAAGLYRSSVDIDEGNRAVELAKARCGAPSPRVVTDVEGSAAFPT